MAQRRHHYEQAFEQYLRTARVPYVAVDEAKKALMPEGTPLRVRTPDGTVGGHEQSLKSFDFVIYGSAESRRSGDGGACNMLVEVKGRRVGCVDPRSVAGDGVRRMPRLESWVTLEDVWSLRAWSELFGPEFQAVFVFVYWCDEQPPDALFQEIFEHHGRWYAVRAVTLDRYEAAMRTRSPRWGTVHVSAPVFERISQPLLPVVGRVRPMRGDGFGPSPLPALGAMHAQDFGPELPALEP